MVKTGLYSLLPKHLQEMEAALPAISSTKLPAVSKPASGAVRGKVALLTGCVMDAVFSHIHEATVRVLLENGYEVVIPSGQRCCGALHVHAGDRKEAKRLAKQNITAFLQADVDYVIVNAAGCGAALKEYPELLRNDVQWSHRAQQFAEKVQDIAKFLHDNGFRAPDCELNLRLTYHDACHLAHAQGITREPRQLLQQIPGVELIPLPDADRCCGSAGIYNLTHPEMAGRLLKRKIDDIPDGVEWIATGNPGCFMQIALGLHKYGRTEKVAHTVEILDWAYQKEKEAKQNQLLFPSL
jgi:glycolate oxidase iron-sulfur subunit